MMGYLKFFGKIKAEQIMNNGTDNAGSWIGAREYCLVNNSKGDTSSTYSAVVGQKTKNGHWTIGHLNDSNDNLEFVYTTDANYNARNNVATYRAILRPKAGNLAFTNEIWSAVYPVGALYISWSSTSPASLFGGTWERLSGGFLYGAVNSAGAGNGTGTSSGSTTLSINQIPAHSHAQYVSANNGNIAIRKDYSSDGNSSIYPQGNDTASAGGGQGHNHTIPYIAAFIWRRTA